MLKLYDSAEARFWFLHMCALIGAFLFGHLIGARLAPFLSLLACRPLMGLVLSMLPQGGNRDFRPHLATGALLLAVLVYAVPAREAAVYPLLILYLLALDLLLDALVVRCCPPQEWVGKTAGLGLARATGLLLGLIASGSNPAGSPLGISLALLALACLWALSRSEVAGQKPGFKAGGLESLRATVREWTSTALLGGSFLWLVAAALLAGLAGSSLFPLLVLAPSTVTDWMGDPSRWLGVGALWVLVAFSIERLSLPSLLLATVLPALLALWLSGPLELWPATLEIALGLATLALYRAALTAQTERVDPVLQSTLPLTLWTLGQLLGAHAASAWPQSVLAWKLGGSLVLLSALPWAYRRWIPSQRLAEGGISKEEREPGRHGDRKFDFAAVPMPQRKKRSRWLSRLWYHLTVQFPVTLTVALLSSFLLVGAWRLSEQRSSLKSRVRNASLAFQTQLFVSRLKVRLEEEMLASGRVPDDWADFIGASFQLHGRPLKDRDFWGTPLQFENSPKEIRIVSAGPDKKLFTPDDIARTVTKPQGVQ